MSQVRNARWRELRASTKPYKRKLASLDPDIIRPEKHKWVPQGLSSLWEVSIHSALQGVPELESTSNNYVLISHLTFYSNTAQQAQGRFQPFQIRKANNIPHSPPNQNHSKLMSYLWWVISTTDAEPMSGLQEVSCWASKAGREIPVHVKRKREFWVILKRFGFQIISLCNTRHALVDLAAWPSPPRRGVSHSARKCSSTSSEIKDKLYPQGDHQRNQILCK